ncbi:dipeptide epimerase [Gracilimonas sp.]|uniref:dipeptide epimerase n=1 Tax=Gracilimonas sp. TaxID=1974203 RepID=UPI002870D06A|nr:dipeptide epimerase [Gracilimonas sp.]
MSHFDVSWKIVPLSLKHAFTISRSSRTEARNVFLSISKNGITGYGEAAPNSRYEETPEKVIEYFRALPTHLFDEISSPENLPQKLDNSELPSIQSAKVAIEMAWLDWWGKSQNAPLWKLWKAKSPVGPVTSFTIGIDKPEIMQKKIEEAAHYPVYKIKLGTDRDREIIKAIREVTTKPLRVDANEGWKSLKQAKREIEFLSDQNVEFIEQPMPASCLEDMKQLKMWSPLPLAADESFVGSENLLEISEAFDIINIKLMKIGSLIKARNVISNAKDIGLKVMIGCMIESSLANAAGALIALEADYADLDGHLLIDNDPFEGLSVYPKGNVALCDNLGLGVSKLDF